CYKNEAHEGFKAKKMDSELISRLNELWQPIYPHLARWIGRHYPGKPSLTLELGPFSGGISKGFKGLFENVRTLCLMSEAEVAGSIRNQFGWNLEVLVGSPERLPLRASFDLAVYRGAFFFLTPEIIKETYRVLKPAGRALLGGGYGPLTPLEEMVKIAEESKRLNYRLGKKWISRGELEEMVREAEMERDSKILEQGGLWLLLEKK
ncbi:MAG: methyltransferase domain-containing protein, partial [Desulfobacteraceae bacterium]